MSRVNCIYCGERFSGELPHCPACGAPSHFRQRGWRPGAQRRFALWVALLAIACILIALWLPR
ncbi:protein nirD [Thioalbus denitrificans]|jgi:hypothetical protein|uniref:Protein DnrP n=1 Tax=Thioalbus denitrificans TaxID=547122 RepID=A0A369CJ60_9GAMM|nr:protein nirD [Thioalbus denitrificans]RCX33328.1 hypothetical protein DFQ59_101629 [Thioalbus denitrificans]